jgi:hypothetical protein
LGDGEREITVRMLDISEGGVGLLSPFEIPDASAFTVEFVFPTMQEIFRAELHAENRNGFRYGFSFAGLNEGQMALLRKYQRRWGIRAQ